MAKHTPSVFPVRKSPYRVKAPASSEEHDVFEVGDGRWRRCKFQIGRFIEYKGCTYFSFYIITVNLNDQHSCPEESNVWNLDTAVRIKADFVFRILSICISITWKRWMTSKKNRNVQERRREEDISVNEMYVCARWALQWTLKLAELILGPILSQKTDITNNWSKPNLKQESA